MEVIAKKIETEIDFFSFRARVKAKPKIGRSVSNTTCFLTCEIKKTTVGLCSFEIKKTCKSSF